MILLRLFWEFFKTGLFAVGGGMATLPFLQEMGASTGWFTAGQLADMVAVSESTPGPIGVNMATYVGFTTAGIGGAVIATLGLVTPSVIIILIIAALLRNFRNNRYVDAAFYGLRPASSGLITAALLSLIAIALLRARAASAGICDISQKGRTLRFTFARFALEAVAAVCASPEYKKRVFLSPNTEKPLLTLHLAAGENALQAAQQFLRAYQAGN